MYKKIKEDNMKNAKIITGIQLLLNTRYLIYQSRVKEDIIVIFLLLSYEHPQKPAGLLLFG